MIQLGMQAITALLCGFVAGLIVATAAIFYLALRTRPY
jgi:energy-converting hydrogenase Eha subunit G